MRDIFDFGDTDEVATKIERAAELFDYPAFRFRLALERRPKIKDAVLKHDISFYEDAIKQLNVLSDERTRLFELAHFRSIVFVDISSDDLVELREKTDDLYYR